MPKLKEGDKTFGGLLDDATDTAMELKRAQAKPKLTSDAFLRDALLIAQCNEARLNEIEQALDNPHAATGALKAFIRRLVGAFRGKNFSRPTPEPSKLLRAYGSEDANAQISQIRSTIAEIQAYSVRECVGIHEDCFGPVEDFVEYQAAVEKLTKKLDQLYAKMAGAWSGMDVEIDFNLTPDDRRRGLCRISFKRAPDIDPGMDDWPQKMVEHALAKFERTEPREQAMTSSAAFAA